MPMFLVVSAWVIVHRSLRPIWTLWSATSQQPRTVNSPNLWHILTRVLHMSQDHGTGGFVGCLLHCNRSYLGWLPFSPLPDVHRRWKNRTQSSQYPTCICATYCGRVTSSTFSGDQCHWLTTVNKFVTNFVPSWLLEVRLPSTRCTTEADGLLTWAVPQYSIND